MKQYTYSMTDKRTGKSQCARATAANPTIARGQIILAYGGMYEVCDLYCDINPAHRFVGEIDCSDFPLSDLDWPCIDGHFCADGDGMVVVAHDGLQWSVTDQGDPIAAFDYLVDALTFAAKQLADNYPEIYEQVCTIAA